MRSRCLSPQIAFALKLFIGHRGGRRYIATASHNAPTNTPKRKTAAKISSIIRRRPCRGGQRGSGRSSIHYSAKKRASVCSHADDTGALCAVRWPMFWEAVIRNLVGFYTERMLDHQRQRRTQRHCYREHPHHRNRFVRSLRADRPAVSGQPLLHRARQWRRTGSLCGDPRGDARQGRGRFRPCRAGEARTGCHDRALG